MKNVCIVGYGAIGFVHARAVENVERASLYAVCDIDKERCDVCAEKYDVVKYQDFDEVLADERIDSVHICTPHYLHFEMIRRALEAGKEVVTEKPLTMTRAEYEALLQLPGAERVCVVLQNRLNVCVKKMKHMVESGELGKVLTVRGILTWFRDAAYYESGAWRGKWDTEGGGLLINQAIHTLDYFSYVVGDIVNVKADMFNYSLQDVIEVEDTLVAYLEYADGVRGIFFATNAYGKDSLPFFEVVCEKGTLQYTDKTLWLDDEIIEKDRAPVVGKAYWGGSHVELMKRYYDEGKWFNVWDVKNTMETVFAMYESARSRK